LQTVENLQKISKFGREMVWERGCLEKLLNSPAIFFENHKNNFYFLKKYIQDFFWKDRKRVALKMIHSSIGLQQVFVRSSIDPRSKLKKSN